ncbi:hypothetical protein [Oscillatoria acuminata]|uniref:Uncharacterized protein n=1 Tax=Oscillatoria acuminata PCC 6304 TaxID=56110 RepID=K9TGH2_9CYAN|nr:hypothetical protein [Oscillatoria acuminata]AFY81645.1 hypothetical protein Oscil6304_1976 [Oscillatoria acuminata PCC 6304]
MPNIPRDLECGEYSQSHLELELFELLTQTEVPYPWNPTAIETDAYFSTVEAAVEPLWLIDEADFAPQAQTAIAAFERLWSANPSETSAVESVRAALLQKFGTQVPSEWLEAIAERARTLTSSETPIAQRLVQCVSELLPQWTPEDLQVLARPFAYAMRGESLDSTVTTISQKTWSNLSEIEKARLSLAIARYAVSEIENFSA